MMTSQATTASSSPVACMEARVERREREVLEMERRAALSSSRHRARTHRKRHALTGGGVVLLAKDSCRKEIGMTTQNRTCLQLPL